jgi:hypothetical protein
MAHLDRSAVRGVDGASQEAAAMGGFSIRCATVGKAGTTRRRKSKVLVYASAALAGWAEVLWFYPYEEGIQPSLTIGAKALLELTRHRYSAPVSVKILEKKGGKRDD